MFDIYDEIISLAIDNGDENFKENEYLGFEYVEELFFEYGILPIDFNSYRLNQDDQYRYTIMGKLKDNISL